MRVTVWNEGVHERSDPAIAAVYPQGIHHDIAEGLSDLLPDAVIGTATLDDPDQGLPDHVLDETDVLLWWGHIAHDRVDDELVDRVVARVHGGMGLLVLHSGHFSKVFRRLMGTTCALSWRRNDERELVWTIDPSHPIAAGVDQPIVIAQQEMYGEPFDVPHPDEVVFISSFAGGEVFRSGLTYRRGRGRVFYFSPGDEAYPVYRHPHIRRVLANGVRWAVPRDPVTRPSDAIRTEPGDWTR
jgi:trehalose utilization protein